MAKQKGILQLEGTMGGFNFYFRKGEALSRKSGGGFNGTAIKTKDSMVRVRENGSEFGTASKSKKLVRMSVQEALLFATDGTLHGRMMTLFQEIKTYDLLSERGKRTVWEGLKTDTGQKLLAAFLFMPKQAVFPLFGGVPVVTNRGGTLDFNGLQLLKSEFKGSATHVILHYFVVDYVPDQLTFQRYSAVKVTVAKTDLNAALLRFGIADLPPTFSCRMSYLAVQFYEDCNGKLMELREQGMSGLRGFVVFGD